MMIKFDSTKCNGCRIYADIYNMDVLMLDTGDWGASG